MKDLYKGLFWYTTTMNTSAQNVTGSILYFIGMMMIILPVIALVVSGGMVILAGPIFLSLPIIGVVPTVVGKKMINEAKRLDDEKRANDELRRVDDAKTASTSNNPKV
jgi:cadmium resistance protein CadD (predicted permease)